MLPTKVVSYISVCAHLHVIKMKYNVRVLYTVQWMYAKLNEKAAPCCSKNNLNFERNNVVQHKKHDTFG